MGTPRPIFERVAAECLLIACFITKETERNKGRHEEWNIMDPSLP